MHLFIYACHNNQLRKYKCMEKDVPLRLKTAAAIIIYFWTKI